MAIYLRWCMAHDLMGEDVLKEYSEVAKQVKEDSASVDLREFIRDELDGCLFSVLFNQQGRAFADKDQRNHNSLPEGQKKDFLYWSTYIYQRAQEEPPPDKKRKNPWPP